MSDAITRQNITLEYTVRVSPSLLFEYITDPVRMQEWFADEVESRDKNTTYIFKWKNSNETQIARVIHKEVGKSISFKMIDPKGGEDWQMSFTIVSTELSKSTILVIEDVVDSDSLEIYEQLWNGQIKALSHIFGN